MSDGTPLRTSMRWNTAYTSVFAPALQDVASPCADDQPHELAAEALKLNNGNIALAHTRKPR